MSIARIRKNDTVVVVSGNEAGKTGIVKSIDTAKGTAIVSNLNLHVKAMRRTEKNEGGLIKIEAPIKLCKLMPYDAKAKKGTRVKTGEKDGKKARLSVKSGETL